LLKGRRVLALSAHRLRDPFFLQRRLAGTGRRGLSKVVVEVMVAPMATINRISEARESVETISKDRSLNSMVILGVLIKVTMRVAMLMVKGLHRVTTKVTVDRLATGSMVIEVDLLVVEAVGGTDSYQERIAHPFSQQGDSKMLPLNPLPLQVARKIILEQVLQRRNKARLEVLWLQIRMFNLRRIIRLVRTRSLKNVFVVISLLIMLVLSVQLLYAYIAILLYIRMLIVTC
jgi:hypothetical protein